MRDSANSIVIQDTFSLATAFIGIKPNQRTRLSGSYKKKNKHCLAKVLADPFVYSSNSGARQTRRKT